MTITKEAVEAARQELELSHARCGEGAILGIETVPQIGHHVQLLLDAREAQFDALLARNAALVAEQDEKEKQIRALFRGAAAVSGKPLSWFNNAGEFLQWVKNGMAERDAALAQVSALKAELEAKWRPVHFIRSIGSRGMSFVCAPDEMHEINAPIKAVMSWGDTTCPDCLKSVIKQAIAASQP